jgi:uncharacterized protein YcbX
MSQLIVSELAIYPVKSMRQVPVEKAVIDMGGLENDRRWMVVDSDGRMITQRQQSRLSLIQPELIEGGICLQATGLQELKVEIPKQNHTTVSVWNDRCNAYDAGNEAGQWLSQFLGVECRLVYFPGNEVRTVDQNYAQQGDRTAFSDGFPVLVISQASLDDLNSRMQEPVPMARFRPNVVVSGCEAFAEDSWKQLKIAGLHMRIVKPCSRCVIPSIDIESGERSKNFEPTKTLSSFRRRDNQIFFGQNAVIDGEGEIKVGMSVEVIK